MAGAHALSRQNNAETLANLGINIGGFHQIHGLLVAEKVALAIDYVDDHVIGQIVVIDLDAAHGTLHCTEQIVVE